MQMEDLTKTQIVLLTLLVSFVTSIATGIVTVALVDQAPPGVTQTINRVVERTVEKVVPGQAAGVVTKETTVVVKEEDLVIDAVDKNSRNVVVFETEEGTEVGLGFLVSQDGLIVVDSSILAAKSLKAVVSNGKKYAVETSKVDSDLGLALFQIIPAEDSPEDLKFARVSLREASSIKLGQTVIALGGLSERSVVTGIVSKINTVEKEVPANPENGTATTTQQSVSSITTSIVIDDEYEGSPLIDIDGLVVGINIRNASGGITLPANVILGLIESARAESKTAESNTETPSSN